MKVFARQALEMRLRRLFRPGSPRTGGRRKIVDAGQRLQPAGNFILSLEGIVFGQLADNPAQFARIGQRMIDFLGKQCPQRRYLFRTRFTPVSSKSMKR